MTEDKKDITLEAEIDSAEEYIKRMQAFSKFYISILVLVAAIMAGAIAAAVLYDVIAGISLGFFGAVLYAVQVPDRMSREVGVRYVSLAGGIRITACRARYGERLLIPNRLMWFDVIEIGDGAFSSDKNAELKEVFLPSTLKMIGKDVFSGCDALETIYYGGSKEDFGGVCSETDLSSFKIVFDAEYPKIPKKKN